MSRGTADDHLPLPAGRDEARTWAGPPAEPPWDYPALFAIERDRLSALLGGLRHADWERPSPCPGWTVLGLSVHLLGGDFGLLARHRDGYLGTPAPDGAGEAEFVAWLDAMQAEWVSAARRLSPRLVTDLLRWTGPQAAATLGQEDPRAYGASVWWAGPDQVPNWLDQARELSEYWIHRQQLLQALGRPSDLRPDLAGPVLDGLRWAYPYRLARAGIRRAGTVAIRVTGQVSRDWRLAAHAGRWAFRAEPGSPVIASLVMTTEQAWRLLTSNLPARDQDHLATAGDASIIGTLLHTRAIIGSPAWASLP